MNVDLAQRTLTHIEANPKEWQQAVWRCNTGMCFAGWAVVLAGGRWVVSNPTGEDSDEDFLWPEPDDDPSDLTEVGPAGADLKGVHVEVRACRVLGVDADQAEVLFDPDNRLADLQEIIGELANP